MNFLKSIGLGLILTISVSLQTQAQNCGLVTNYTQTITALGNGTYDFRFTVVIETTSGGNKSVNLTISNGTTTFLSSVCEITGTSPITLNYGPINSTVNTWATLDWNGHTNAACGGTTCSGATGVLPVELISFKANIVGNNTVELAWSTASEANNQGFEIQKTLDSEAWKTIGWVDGNGFSSSLKLYNFQDEAFAGQTAHYRLKQIDYDGKFEYSPVISVTAETTNEVRVHPNPVMHKFQVHGTYDEVVVYNLMGKKLDLDYSTQGFVQTESLTSGVYFVEITSGRSVKRIKFIKE